MNINRLTMLPYLLLGLLIIPAFIPATAAVPPPQTETVSTRVRPELVPLGVAFSSSHADLTATYKLDYDDNVLATANNTKSSFISTISPTLAIQTDWRNHQFNLLADLNIGRHSGLSSEDYEDWNISTSGQFEIRHNTRLIIGGNLGQQHIPRVSPNDENGSSPTEYYDGTVFSRYFQKPGRFKINLSASFRRKNFDDISAIRNNTPITINQDDRDRNIYTGRLRIGYELLPSYEVFFNIQRNHRDYDESEDFSNIDRTSKGYEVALGTAFDLYGMAFGEIFARYHAQDYKAPLPDISAPEFGTTLNWNVTTLTTININLYRTIEETINTNYAGYISTTTRLGIDHELRRNLLLKASFQYISNDYKGIATAERDDTTSDILVGLTYMINRHLNVTMQYDYTKRKSNSTVISNRGNEYEKNILSIQFQVQL